jgi:tetratricopeptide (TPR) repeat protein
MPQPATKLTQISEDILAIINKDSLTCRLSEFEIQKVFNYTEKLKPLDIAVYHSYLGVAYSLIGKKHEALGYHKKAVEQRPEDIIIVSNYGTSLMRLGMYSEAEEQMMFVYSLNKGDQLSLSNAIISAYYADNLDNLQPLLEAYKKITLSPHEVEEWLEEDAYDMETLPELLEESRKGEQIPWEQVKKELGL